MNPNIPWKTRGNGAICLRFGRGSGKQFEIGRIKNKTIKVFSKGTKKKLEKNDIEKIKKIVKEIIQKFAKFEDNDTNPGVVFSTKKLPFLIYNKAVKEVVSLNEIKEYLEKHNIDFEGYKNSRGLIGSTASIAWEPIIDKTYEIISYREEKKWGTKRYVNDLSVIEMDKKYRSTFDNYDYENNHNRITPNSPCPILHGIRGDIPEDLIKAREIVESEKVESWILFESNQGTDDHLKKTKIANIKPFESYIIKGVITKIPKIIRGGHVIFSLQNDNFDKISCAAYEPTKHFRRIIRKLYIGDEIVVYGGVREVPLTINIEKIEIKKFVKNFVKIENPICNICGIHMKSKGKGAVYKCKKCSKITKNPVLIHKKRDLELGFYEVPVCARRHLSKPIQRVEEQ